MRERRRSGATTGCRRLVTAAMPVLLAATTAWSADPSSELERLRTENARLEARVRELEAARAEAERRCPPAVAEAMQRAANDSLQVTTSPETGETTVATTASAVTRSGGSGRQWLSVQAATDPGGGERAVLTVDARSATALYGATKTAQITIDGGAPESLPVTSYTATPIRIESRQGPRVVGQAESVSAALPPAMLPRLAAARDASVTLGATTFRFTPEQLMGVRAVAARLGGGR